MKNIFIVGACLFPIISTQWACSFCGEKNPDIITWCDYCGTKR